MQSQRILRSAVVVSALISLSPAPQAAGPGLAPTGTSLIPPTVRGADDEGFFGELKRTESGFSWKGIGIVPSFNYRAFYTDNLFNYRQGTDKQDFLHYVSPQLLLTRDFHIGEWIGLISAGYTPTFVVHSINGEFDRTEHVVRAGIIASLDDRQISLDHSYRKSSEITSELGFLTAQESHQTGLGYQQPLTGRISLQTSANQTLTDTTTTAGVTSARSIKSWGGNAFLMYELKGKTATGLGGGATYQEQTGIFGNYESVFEQVMNRWQYNATGKLKFSVDVGVQFGQSLQTGIADPSPTPIANASVQYAPRYGTTFSLTGARTSGLSQTQSGQNSTENRVTFGVTQRIYQTMSAGINAGFGHGSFSDRRIGGGGIGDRAYDNYNVGLQYNWQLSDHWQLTAFYQFMRRESDFARETYSNNQVGFSVHLSL